MEIDLFNPDSFADGQPHDQYRWLRENDPVHRHPEPAGPGFWAITRYDDVRAVSRDTETFSSEPTVMITDPPLDTPEMSGEARMMLMMDPPDHRRYRMLVVRGFTPPSARRIAPRIEELAIAIIDEVIERGECDLVTDIAGELPSYVIAELMGIPLDDGRKLYDLTEKMHAAPGTIPEYEQAAAAMEMLQYASGVAEEKRRDPGDDLASALVQSEIDGDRLTDLEFNLFFLLLINAGGDTTRNLVAGGMHALFDHPDERRRIQADIDTLMPTTVEELLRFVSPVVHMRRTATTATVIGNEQIAEGDKVVVYYGSANRDAAVFPNPDRLDSGRAPNDHLAFGGGGPHFCLGAHVARIEIAAMLRQILTRLPDIEPAGPTDWQASNFISGPRHLPVRFSPGRRST